MAAVVEVRWLIETLAYSVLSSLMAAGTSVVLVNDKVAVVGRSLVVAELLAPEATAIQKRSFETPD